MHQTGLGYGWAFRRLGSRLQSASVQGSSSIQPAASAPSLPMCALQVFWHLLVLWSQKETLHEPVHTHIHMHTHAYTQGHIYTVLEFVPAPTHSCVHLALGGSLQLLLELTLAI